MSNQPMILGCVLTAKLIFTELTDKKKEMNALGLNGV